MEMIKYSTVFFSVNEVDNSRNFNSFNISNTINSLNSQKSEYFTLSNVTVPSSLIKLVFSYLSKPDQFNVYLTNKNLGQLLPDYTRLRYNNINYNKCFSYNMNPSASNLLELSDGKISCWTLKRIELLELFNNKLNFVKCVSYDGEDTKVYPTHHNGNIIYTTAMGFCFVICDKDFKIIEKFEESDYICSICNMNDLTFILGFWSGTIKIYSRNRTSTKYKVIKEYKHQLAGIRSLLYLPEHNYILSGASDKSINVFTRGKSIQRYTDHNHIVHSLILINEETFASSSSDGVIKFWSIKEEINCIKTIKAHIGKDDFIRLFNLGKDLMVSKSLNEIKIWDLKNFECLKTYREDSGIYDMIITKNNYFITATKDKKINVWKLS